MTNGAIHRVIEHHAAARGDSTALINRRRRVTYGELNVRANTMARRLGANGFRRGGHAWVHMPRGEELAIVLLAILKAGGSYTWLDPARSDSAFPIGISLSVSASQTEEECHYVDVAPLLNDHITSSPNLPIVTRGTDIACILRDEDGAPVILVPHATMTALQTHDAPQPAAWTGEPGALDLWMALITGRTAVVEEEAAETAAA